MFTVGMKIARRCPNPKASNLAEILEIYPEGRVRLQHLEHGKKQTIVNLETLGANWKPAPTVAPSDARMVTLELRAEDQDKRIAAPEGTLKKLTTALGGI